MEDLSRACLRLCLLGLLGCHWNRRLNNRAESILLIIKKKRFNLSEMFLKKNQKIKSTLTAMSCLFNFQNLPFLILKYVKTQGEKKKIERSWKFLCRTFFLPGRQTSSPWCLLFLSLAIVSDFDTVPNVPHYPAADSTLQTNILRTAGARRWPVQVTELVLCTWVGKKCFLRDFLLAE